MNLQQQDRFYEMMTRLRGNSNSRAASVPSVTKITNGLIISRPVQVQEPEIIDLQEYANSNNNNNRSPDRAASVGSINKLKTIKDFIRSNGRYWLKLPKDKTAVRNRLEELSRLNEEYLQTATTEADVHFYNAVQSILHATALKLYGYTKDKDYQMEADLHLLVAQVEHIRLLEAATDKEKDKKVVIIRQGQGIEYTDQRQ